MTHYGETDCDKNIFYAHSKQKEFLKVESFSFEKIQL
jgi:hypothetical protein